MVVTSGDAVLTSLLLLSAAASAADDSAAPIPPPQNSFFYPSMGSVFFAFLFTIFFICFFSVYLRLRYNASGANRLLPAASIRLRSPATGLDATVIESFPVLLYSEVEEHKACKGALECAICLNEFQEDETLRLIPKCDHVFHPECIDAWLASHVTCPVCRANLFPEPDKITHTGSSHPEPGNPEGADTISVRVVPQESIDSIPAAQDQVLGRQIRLLGKFPKSHSTGHSLVQFGERIERFTLRLPDHVRSEVITRALTRAATFNIREGSSRRGKRSSVGEGSSRGVSLYKQLDRRFKSDRWAVMVPFWSQGRVSVGDGEGSTGRGIRTSVKLPSLSCLGPAASGDGSGSVNPGSDRAEV